jgi:uncharacterized protein YcbX
MRESRDMVVGTVAKLWRYPVKSLGAESLTRAEVLGDGLAGDRAAALVVETATHARAGKPFRGKESALLHLTTDPATAASYAANANVHVSLTTEPARWFDLRPVSVLLDLWLRDVEALVGEALDPLRFRPNLFIATDPGFAKREDDLVGTVLRAGTVELQVVETNKRCVTTTYDVDTGASEPRVLREVALNRDNVVGIYCEVLAPGFVSLGDELTTG